jgi:hypothetical protein
MGSFRDGFSQKKLLPAIAKRGIRVIYLSLRRGGYKSAPGSEIVFQSFGEFYEAKNGNN